MQVLFLLFAFVRIAILFGVFLFARWSIRKLLCQIPHFLRITAIVLLFSLLCAGIDLVLAVNHSDPLMAFPVVFYGDGGSGTYIGPLYTVSRCVAYELGSGEAPYFDYSVKPWLV